MSPPYQPILRRRIGCTWVVLLCWMTFLCWFLCYVLLWYGMGTCVDDEQDDLLWGNLLQSVVAAVAAADRIFVVKERRKKKSRSKNIQLNQSAGSGSCNNTKK
eukprot:GEZU01018969.1.p1 GENE.GEZU01018969.1~~GEZU01018969.1.p1  ORF type:complete len:103 (-),score=6.26 GEZU01018969.1:64-372(-)